MNIETQKVVLLSANEFGYKVMIHLDESFAPNPVTNIITLSPDSTTVMYDSVEPEQWSEFGLPLDFVKDSEGLKATLEIIKPDLVMMIGWRQTLPLEVLSIPKLGVVGFHPTLLPIGRGPAPIINTILEGFTHSGVSMFYVSPELDTGDIIVQSHFDIDPKETATSLYQKVAHEGCILATAMIEDILSGKAPRTRQDGSKATYFRKLSLADNEIFLSDTPDLISKKIRALTHPYRGAFMRTPHGKLIIWEGEYRTDGK